jgi:hypothetical protein
MTASKPYRILVTGSRDWDNWPAISNALNGVTWRKVPPFGSEEIILVHGGCPAGADGMADTEASIRGWQVEVHPARWDEHGKRAGIIRNIEMVDAGADVCLAFIRGNSRGATHCADAAERAGIPVRRFTANGDPS